MSGPLSVGVENFQTYHWKNSYVAAVVHTCKLGANLS